MVRPYLAAVAAHRLDADVQDLCGVDPSRCRGEDDGGLCDVLGPGVHRPDAGRGLRRPVVVADDEAVALGAPLDDAVLAVTDRLAVVADQPPGAPFLAPVRFLAVERDRPDHDAALGARIDGAAVTGRPVGVEIGRYVAVLRWVPRSEESSD